jgi:hypothetical protein
VRIDTALLGRDRGKIVPAISVRAGLPNWHRTCDLTVRDRTSSIVFYSYNIILILPRGPIQIGPHPLPASLSDPTSTHLQSLFKKTLPVNRHKLTPEVTASTYRKRRRNGRDGASLAVSCAMHIHIDAAFLRPILTLLGTIHRSEREKYERT